MAEPKTPKGKVRGPKYANDAAILQLYYGQPVLDPIVAAITPDAWEADLNDFADMLNDWDETAPEA